MKFLFGTELTAATKQIVESDNVRIAVAFWGSDGPERIGLNVSKRTDWKIVCNLTMGGTNPKAIENLGSSSGEKWRHIRHSPRLHAKVFLCETSAIVGSNNVSANGLSLEGEEQVGWDEAGVLITDPQELLRIAGWFEKIWKSAKQVDAPALKAAERARRRRRTTRPQLGGLEALEPSADDFPLIVSWENDESYDLHTEEMEKQMGHINEEAKRQIHDGIELENEEDLRHLFEGRWVLQWKRMANGQPDEANFSWTRLSGQIVRNAYSYKGESLHRDAVLASTGDWTPPFKLERKNAARIAQLLGSRKYSSLRTENYTGAWFAPRLEDMRQFWKDLKST